MAPVFVIPPLVLLIDLVIVSPSASTLNPFIVIDPADKSPVTPNVPPIIASATTFKPFPVSLLNVNVPVILVSSFTVKSRLKMV